MDRYPDRRRSHVVLIGASDFERSDRLPNLPAVWNNLVDLQAALTNADTGVFDAAQITVLASPDSPKTMSRRLATAANSTEDVLLVYYAGHGLLDWDGALYLAVGETDPDQVEATAVPFEWVKRAIENSPAASRLLILDCCFSGRAVGAMSDDSAALLQVDVRGAAVLTSTAANRISNSVPGEQHTAFTAELIRLLRDGDRSPYQSLRVGDLYRPLRASLAKRRLPEPKIAMTDSVGDLVIRRALGRPPEPSERAGVEKAVRISHLPRVSRVASVPVPVVRPVNAPPAEPPVETRPRPAAQPMIPPPAWPAVPSPRERLDRWLSSMRKVRLARSGPKPSGPKADQVVAEAVAAPPVTAARTGRIPFGVRVVLTVLLWLLTLFGLALLVTGIIETTTYSNEQFWASISAIVAIVIPTSGLVLLAYFDMRWYLRRSATKRVGLGP